MPTVATAQISDVDPPQLLAFSISPTTIDTTGGPQPLTIGATIADNLSGLNYCGVDLRSASGQTQGAFLGQGQLVSGTPLNGTYETTIQFPQFTESGLWVVQFIVCFDTVFNQMFVDTAGLQAAGFPASFTVVSNPDTTPPQITRFSVLPGSVDVSSGPQTVTIELDLNDALSGVDFGLSRYSAASLIMQSPSGQQTHVIGNDRFIQTGGTALNGTWAASFTLPRYSEPGIWRLQRLFLDDAVGNNEYLTDADLQALGLSSALSVTAVPADTTPPAVSTLSIVPPFINASIGPQTVAIALGATDNLAGVSFTPSWPFTTCFEDVTNSEKRVGLLFVSPSGAQTRCLEPDNGFGSSPIVQTAGSPQNGVWEGSIFFPQFSEAGTWHASLILKDEDENFVSYDTAALRALGLPTDIEIIMPSLVPDATLDAAGGTVVDGEFGSRAEVIVPPGVLGGPTEVAIDVLTSPLSLPSPSGYSAPGTYFVNIQFTPTPAFPLPAPGLTIVLPLPTPMAEGSRLDLFRVDPATGMLVPSLDALGHLVTGTVDPGGVSATFTGISHLSTVVGLVPAFAALTPTVVVTGGTFTYDGQPHPATASATGVGGVVLSGSFTFTYTPGGSSAPVNGGTYHVSVTFVPSDTAYETVTASGTITITPATPVISWPQPSAIVEGTALGAAQLNAAVDAPGVLTYAPPAGTVLDDGPHTLAVSFTPANPANFTTASRTVTIDVVPAPGRLEGGGQTDAAGVRYEFEFMVLERANGAERGMLRLEVERIGRETRANFIGEFVATRIDRVIFSDDPRSRPGRKPRPAIDTADFSGVGRWNHMAGYTFTAQATDSGEPGRGRDLFAITIRDPHGVTVATVNGAIARGNIQSSRIR